MSVSDVRKTQCLSYQGPRLIKFHLPATHPAHTVSKTPQSAGQKGCFGRSVCQVASWNSHPPAPSPASPLVFTVHGKACGSALVQRPQMILYPLVSPLMGIESPPLSLVTVKSLLGLSAPKLFRNYSAEGCLLSKATPPSWGNLLTPGLCSSKGI